MMMMVRGMVSSVMAMMNAKDAEQKLQHEKRAAGRRTTQEYPHHTTYTWFRGHAAALGRWQRRYRVYWQQRMSE